MKYWGEEVYKMRERKGTDNVRWESEHAQTGERRNRAPLNSSSITQKKYAPIPKWLIGQDATKI